jgi:outer membrane protein, heavy metal efflux system
MKRSFVSFSLVSVGLFTLVAAVLADENTVTNEVTLEVLVADALEHNPELKFYRAEISAAKGDLQNAGARPNPEAAFELGHKRARDAAGLVGEGAAWRVSVSQAFEFPGRIALRKAVADRQIELAELGLARFRAGLSAKVRSLGYTLLVAQEKADAALEAARRGEELVAVLVQREPAGVPPLLERRIIEANVITLKRKSIEFSKAAQDALFDLNQLRGQPLSIPLRVASVPLRFGKLPASEELLNAAFTNNFELQSRQVEFAQQGIKVDLAKKERWSAVTIEPFYSQEKGNETERTIGLGVSMPLPLWNRNAGNVETAKARMEQAETSLQLTWRQIERDVRGNALAYETQLAEINRLSPGAADQLREAAELGDRHYRLGSLPVATYVELQTQYLEALEAVLQTQAEALENLQQLELLTGLKLRSMP